jgi:hypothetical protein
MVPAAVVGKNGRSEKLLKILKSPFFMRFGSQLGRTCVVSSSYHAYPLFDVSGLRSEQIANKE